MTGNFSSNIPSNETDYHSICVDRRMAGVAGAFTAISAVVHPALSTPMLKIRSRSVCRPARRGAPGTAGPPPLSARVRAERTAAVGPRLSASRRGLALAVTEAGDSAPRGELVARVVGWHGRAVPSLGLPILSQTGARSRSTTARTLRTRPSSLASARLPRVDSCSRRASGRARCPDRPSRRPHGRNFRCPQTHLVRPPRRRATHPLQLSGRPERRSAVTSR